MDNCTTVTTLQTAEGSSVSTPNWDDSLIAGSSSSCLQEQQLLPQLQLLQTSSSSEEEESTTTSLKLSDEVEYTSIVIQEVTPAAELPVETEYVTVASALSEESPKEGQEEDGAKNPSKFTPEAQQENVDKHKWCQTFIYTYAAWMLDKCQLDINMRVLMKRNHQNNHHASWSRCWI